MVFSGEICTLEVVLHGNIFNSAVLSEGRGRQCWGDAPTTAQLQLLAVAPPEQQEFAPIHPKCGIRAQLPCTGAAGVSQLHPGCQGWLWLGCWREGSSVCLGLAEGSVSPRMLHGHLCDRGGTAGTAEVQCDCPALLGSDPQESLGSPRQTPLAKALTNFLYCDFPPLNCVRHFWSWALLQTISLWQ